MAGNEHVRRLHLQFSDLLLTFGLQVTLVIAPTVGMQVLALTLTLTLTLTLMGYALPHKAENMGSALSPAVQAFLQLLLVRTRL